MRIFAVVLTMLFCSAVALYPGCGPGDTKEKAAEAAGDASTQDTAADTATTDTGGTDTGTADTAADSGPVDTGTPDAVAEQPAEKTPEAVAEVAPEAKPEAAAEVTPETKPEATPEATPETTPEKMTNAGVPTTGATLFPWLQAKKYSAYPAESAVHKSNSVHGGGVRVFINAVLDASLKAGNKTHPKGAALIKELWTADLKTLKGWAVQVKIDANSNGGKGWYWYEIFSTTSPNNPVANGTGDTKCTGCHSAGVDYMRTKYPLQ